MSTQEKLDHFFGEAKIVGADKVVLVEDWDDEIFWRDILESTLVNIKLDFPYLANGKDSLLRDFANSVSEKLLLCIDSDNEALTQSKYNQFLHPRKPFIYQTYSHSIENHFVYPENMSRECRDLSRKDYNFRSDFVDFSCALFNWMVIWLFCNHADRKWVFGESEPLKQALAWETLGKIIDEVCSEPWIKKVETLEDIKTIAPRMRVAADEHAHLLTNLLIEHGFSKEELEEFKVSLPFQPEETLFYVQGHKSWDLMSRWFQNVVRLLAEQQSLSAKSQEDKNRWKNTAQHDHLNRLKISYRLCLMQTQPCRLIEQILADIRIDLSPK